MEVAELVAADVPPLITIEDASRVLRLSRSAAYRAAMAGQIPTVRLGRRLFVPTARLLHMLGFHSEGEARVP